MRAITLHQPWAFAVVECHSQPAKDTENRSWPAPEGQIGTRLQIHAGLSFDTRAMLARHSRAAARRLDELGGRAGFWDARHHLPSRMLPPPPPALARYAIIGSAVLTGCHTVAPGCCTSPWADVPDPVGRRPLVHWQLAAQRALPAPVICRGRQRLWKVPENIACQVLDQDPHADTP